LLSGIFFIPVLGQTGDYLEFSFCVACIAVATGVFPLFYLAFLTMTSDKSVARPRPNEMIPYSRN